MNLDQIIGLIDKAPEYVAALNAVILAVIALCLLIPGEQPEKALRGVAGFLGKFSRKPPQPPQAK